MVSPENIYDSETDGFIFLISDNYKKSYLGGGFLVQVASGFYIITAAHVVADALGISRDKLDNSTLGKINVFFPKSNIWLQAELTSYISPYYSNDVAVLRLLSSPPYIEPAKLAGSVNTHGRQFISVGIREAGSRAQGIILGHELMPRNAQKRRRLELNSPNIDGGMSGSPIIDEVNNCVVGMIVSTWYSNTGKDEYTAYGVTSETIMEVFSEATIIEPDSINYRLTELASRISCRYESPVDESSLLFGIGTEAYVDMGLWEYGVEYADETTIQFSWLSEAEKEAQRKKGLISESAIEYLLEWIDLPNPPALAILAEFGMGKSTLLRRLEYLLAKRFLTTNTNIPIRLPLSYKSGVCRTNESLIEKIKMFIYEEYQLKFDVQEIEAIIKEGKSVLILDSFDEMSTSPTPGTQALGLNQIARDIGTINNLKLIIASRDNYFYGNSDLKELFRTKDPFFPSLEFDVVYLRGFRPKEIKQYLIVRLQEKSDIFWNELQGIHDLTDLARRPILLLMMTVLEKEVITGNIHTRQELYREFIRVWLKRERLNGRIRLADKIILEVLNLLAELTSLDRDRTFPQEEIDRLLMTRFDFTRSEAEDFGSDFKVCCFLGRDQRDCYKFLHDSFREYFFATALQKYINDRNLEILRKTFISIEVSRFLVEGLTNRTEIVEFLRNIIQTEKGSNYLLTNSMMLYELIIQNQNEIHDFYTRLSSNQSNSVSKIYTLPSNFVLIPAGVFLMGSWQGRPDETPVHLVEINEFALCKYPVTNLEFLEFVDSTGYVTEAERLGESKIWTGGKWQVIRGLTWKNPRPDNLGINSRLNHPVVQISWSDCLAFCEWRSNIMGMAVGLPSEAEWEYACRAGNLGKWCFGNDEALLIEYGWYKENLDSTISTQPVGLKRPNFWGLYDMHGNVREWCSDIYEKFPGNNLNWDLGDRYFSISGEPYHVIRGGHFGSTANFLRSSTRVSGKLGLSTDYTGFRLKIKIL